MSNTLKQTGQYFKQALTQIYNLQEATAITRQYFEMKWQIPKYELVINEKKQFSEKEMHVIADDLRRLLRYEPLQYVLGRSYFYGHEFFINSSVLIPRPETEELVALLIEEQSGRKTPALIDIGTGSGVIAISLKLAWPQSCVVALDCSAEALNVVRFNALQLGAEIETVFADILQATPAQLPSVDIIVSNPPYIPHRELSNLAPNVTEYEPHEALFVPDNDPLLFYRCIAQLGLSILNEGGSLYFETYEDYHNELGTLLADLGYRNIRFMSDINGRARFVAANLIRVFQPNQYLVLV
jgi:release factor glutamine methyltransferase